MWVGWSESGARRRAGRLFAWALVGALAVGAWLVLREWTWLVPRPVRRRVADGFLLSLQQYSAGVQA